MLVSDKSSVGCLSRISGIIPNKMPKERIQDPEQADHWEVDKLSNLEDFYSIVPIYCTSLQKLLLKKSLQKMRLIQQTKSI